MQRQNFITIAYMYDCSERKRNMNEISVIYWNVLIWKIYQIILHFYDNYCRFVYIYFGFFYLSPSSDVTSLINLLFLSFYSFRRRKAFFINHEDFSLRALASFITVLGGSLVSWRWFFQVPRSCYFVTFFRTFSSMVSDIRWSEISRCNVMGRKYLSSKKA